MTLEEMMQHVRRHVSEAIQIKSVVGVEPITLTVDVPEIKEVWTLNITREPTLQGVK